MATTRPVLRLHRPPGAPPGPTPARGAALLVAMVLVSVITTLAAGMIWQQWRAVQVESAERSRSQSAWMLVGGLDYARLILREDARSGQPTHLGAPWATPLLETRVSAMLAMDRDNSADTDVDAFLIGRIEDAQSRWNLRRLIGKDQLVPAQVAVLQRLCASLGLPADVASRVAQGLLAARLATAADAPLEPATVEDLVWLGLDAATVARLATAVVLLPQVTPVNLNTASAEVIAAVMPDVDLGSAEQLVQARARERFSKVGDALALIGNPPAPPAGEVDVRSSFFFVDGGMRLEQRLLQERYIVQRRPGLVVQAIARMRQGQVLPPGP